MQFEEDRQRYLKALGVTQWYARNQLPGAAATWLPSFRVESSGHEQMAGELASSQSGNPRLSRLAMVELGSPQEKSDGNQQPSAEAAEKLRDAAVQPRELPTEVEEEFERKEQGSDSASVEEELWYAFSFQGMSVVAELTLVEGNQAAPQEARLLKNIVRSKWGSEAANSFRTFFWPPFSRSGIPHQNHEVQKTLFNEWLGEIAPSSIFFTGRSLESLAPQNPKRSNCLLPPLKEILNSPNLKHRIWEVLMELDRSAQR